MQLNQSQQKLAAEHFNLVFAFLKKYNLDAEEYADILMIGLCQAAGTYNGSTKFTTYAYKCMLREMIRQHKINTRLCEVPRHLIVSIDNPITEDKKVSYENIIIDGKSEKEMLSNIFFNEILSLLTNREQEVVGLLDKGFGLQEIADVYNVDMRSVTRWRKNIKEKVSSYLYSN